MSQEMKLSNTPKVSQGPLQSHLPVFHAMASEELVLGMKPDSMFCILFLSLLFL